jgi:hypothetical protein
MAIRTKKRQIFYATVPPITIDVLNFNWHSSGQGMTFVPSTPAALFTKMMNQVFTNERTAVNSAIPAAFENPAPALKTVFTVAFVRAVNLLCEGDGAAAHLARATLGMLLEARVGAAK